ncbi:hypothetical protein AB4Y30_11610 [Ornithinibacillus sp. 4-3]|uniref:Uncharacterized protein n=1 Tax=Ornithinibacillus sp. 4-3 TaxID=3231488 RepID=A0AB39HMN2_9BACI
MTDKERLEEIEEIEEEVGNGFAIEDLDLNTMTVVNRKHFNWLIQQAERVQELKHDKEHLELIKDRQEEEYRNLHEQNKRYREVIEQLYNYDGDVQAHSALADMLCGEILEESE